MEFLSVGNTDIFSATIQQPAQLESLANGALSKGIDLYRRQDYEGAIREFRRSIGLAPNSTHSSDAASYMANAYIALGDTESAVKAYKDAILRSPDQDDIYISLGNLYFSEGRYDEAAEVYGKAVRIWPSSDNHYALGQAYLNAGRHSEADREFNTVLRMEPDKPGGYYGLGLNFSKQGRYEEAVSIPNSMMATPNWDTLMRIWVKWMRPSASWTSSSRSRRSWQIPSAAICTKSIRQNLCFLLPTRALIT